MRNSFLHSGALGDIIYSLVAIKAYGGGDLYINLPQPLVNVIKPLLIVQDYINEVHCVFDTEGELVNRLPAGCINLDDFRNDGEVFTKHLSQMHIDAMDDAMVVQEGNVVLGKMDMFPDGHYWKKQGIKKPVPQWDWKNEGWLTLPDVYTLPDGIKNKIETIGDYCVINRTPRYQDVNCDWFGECCKISDNGYPVFLGFKDDYDSLLCYMMNYEDIGYIETTDLLQAAYLIKHAKSFTGNQSVLLAIAEGLGIKYRMEQAPNHSNCNLFVERETVINK